MNVNQKRTEITEEQMESREDFSSTSERSKAQSEFVGRDANPRADEQTVQKQLNNDPRDKNNSPVDQLSDR